MSLRGKAICFKSRTRGSIQITIRNTSELANFLNLEQFTRAHVSSLMAHAFDPASCFNSVYQNVARLLNREILRDPQNKEPLAMGTVIAPKWHPYILKLGTLYFEIQKLQVNRYPLVPDTPLKHMQNIIMGFSDGAQFFSTSCVYLISINRHTGQVQTTLISTHSKLAGQTEDLSTIPKKESHGQLLACDSMLNLPT